MCSRLRRAERLFCLFFLFVPATLMAGPVEDIEGPAPSSDISLPEPDGECDFTQEEVRLRDLLLSHPRQQRSELHCDPLLMEYAMMRAQQMASRDEVSHIGPDGQGPNEMLREMGYELPDYYVGGRTNNIESILGGEEKAERTWEMLLESPAHRAHLLGEGRVYAAQRRFGVAHLFDPNSAHRHYWVIVIVEPRDPNQKPMVCSPPPTICVTW